MRYIFTTLAFGVIFLFALALSGHVQQKIELIPKPEYDSVVVNDGRSLCVKRSEMNLIRDWEKKCDQKGEDKMCSLSKSDATTLFETMKWYTSNCR